MARTEIHPVQPVTPGAMERDVGLKLIIAFKVLLGLVYLGVALAVFSLRHRDFTALADRFSDYVWLDTQSAFLNQIFDRVSDGVYTVLSGITPRFMVTIGIGAISAAALELLEAWGLHLRQRWAEYLTVVATAVLIVPELREIARAIVRGESAFKLAFMVGVLIINVLIVAYLVRARRLFEAVVPQADLSRPA